MLSRLPLLHPALSLRLPGVPNTGHLKPVEDQIDAVLCAYIAAHWWYWAVPAESYVWLQRDGLHRGA